jgi:hypothetical protein
MTLGRNVAATLIPTLLKIEKPFSGCHHLVRRFAAMKFPRGVTRGRKTMRRHPTNALASGDIEVFFNRRVLLLADAIVVRI